MPKLPIGSPIQPPPWDKADVAAIQALFNGVANEHQQKRALDWIIQKAAATYDLVYMPGGDGGRDTAFRAGRAFVGQEIVKLTKLKLGLIKD